ncbi:unnamed protein product [Peniophora sp. CBMAI 1063]|nr:unnamed protein product [Peniophora sp. CBMAI 1063]
MKDTMLRAAARLTPRVLATGIHRRRVRVTPEVVAPSGEDVVVAYSSAIGIPHATVITSEVVDLAATDDSSRLRRVGEVTKDTVLFILDGLVQSADACPPLKSTVGALSFLVNHVELVSGNKAQIGEIYAHIHAIVASLADAIPDPTSISPALEASLRTLANVVHAVCVDMEAIGRQRWVLRFIRAKSHNEELEALMKRLERASDAFARTILTSSDVKLTRLLETSQHRGTSTALHVQTRSIIILPNFFFSHTSFPK